MVIIYLDRLNEFGKKHADARKSLATWKDVVQKAHWNNRQAHIHYEEKFAEIRFIGTHADYDRIDPSTV